MWLGVITGKKTHCLTNVHISGWFPYIPSPETWTWDLVLTWSGVSGQTQVRSGLRSGVPHFLIHDMRKFKSPIPTTFCGNFLNYHSHWWCSNVSSSNNGKIVGDLPFVGLRLSLGRNIISRCLTNLVSSSFLSDIRGLGYPFESPPCPQTQYCRSSPK